MRISDWSSDVCSSDLARAAAAVVGQIEGFRPGGDDAGGMHEQRAGDAAAMAQGKAGGAVAVEGEDLDRVVALAAAVDHLQEQEIGRASGRERVLQEV